MRPQITAPNAPSGGTPGITGQGQMNAVIIIIWFGQFCANLRQARLKRPGCGPQAVGSPSCFKQNSVSPGQNSAPQHLLSLMLISKCTVRIILDFLVHFLSFIIYWAVCHWVFHCSVCLVSLRAGRYQDALGPLLNAKRLQQKLGWASFYDNQTQAPPPTSSHWFFTLVGLSSCFQQVDQLEEARDHCDHALRVLTPTETQTNTEDKPLPPDNKPFQPSETSRLDDDRPHPLLLPLLRVMVRLSWQTGKDKRQWEELLQHLEERWVGLDNHPTIKEFLVKHNLQDGEGEG